MRVFSCLLWYFTLRHAWPWTIITCRYQRREATRAEIQLTLDTDSSSQYAMFDETNLKLQYSVVLFQISRNGVNKADIFLLEKQTVPVSFMYDQAPESDLFEKEKKNASLKFHISIFWLELWKPNSKLFRLKGHYLIESQQLATVKLRWSLTFTKKSGKRNHRFDVR